MRSSVVILIFLQLVSDVTAVCCRLCWEDFTCDMFIIDNITSWSANQWPRHMAGIKSGGGEIHCLSGHSQVSASCDITGGSVKWVHLVAAIFYFLTNATLFKTKMSKVQAKQESKKSETKSDRRRVHRCSTGAPLPPQAESVAWWDISLWPVCETEINISIYQSVFLIFTFNFIM